jgi:hypothetical protein
MVPNSLGRELSCSQWEGPRMHSRCLAFFPLKWGWGGGGGGGVRKIFFIFPWSPMYSHKMFLKFPMHSHYVIFKFSMGSHQIPNMFPKFPMCSPTQHVLHSSSLLSHMLWQMLSSFHPYRSAKGEELHTSNLNLIFWGASIVSFLLSDGPIKLTCCRK